MKRFWSIVFGILLAVPMVAQEEPLCTDGTLLFREDFGGNDPSDPEVISDANAARAAVLGMSSGYIPCLSRTSGMSSGKFLVTKQGYQNGIQWHIMDDHTYPNDKTKGYLLQIDGRGDDAPFYTTTIEGLCPGSRLTFSAYVANVMTWGHYTNPNRHDIYPRMKFVLTDPSSGTELATYDTGDIPFDSASIGDNSCWQNSAHWRLIGMNFTVPNGTYRVKLTIYNNVAQNGSGNDFVLDDIEIHLCTPPVTIEGETEVCENGATTLTANLTNDGTFAEPLAYKWWHSLDSVTWSEMSGFNGENLTFDAVQKNDSGWYKVAVSGDGNIENINCRAMSEPFRLRVNECAENLCIDGTLLFREDFGGNDPSDPDVSMVSVPGMSSQYCNSGNSLGSGNYTIRKEGWLNGIQWHRQDDHTYPDDKTRGYLLEVDGMGGAEPFYSKTIDGLCAGSKLTFSAYVVNAHYAGQLDYFGGRYIYPRMKFVLKDPTTGSILAEKSTGDIQPDWRYGTPETWKYARENKLSAEWQLIGMNFVVPDGIESIQMFIYNDVERNGTGNDFALDDIEIHLCAPPVAIEGETEVCENTATTLTANFTNDGTFAEPLAYKWWHSKDSVTWSEMSGFIGKNPSIDAIQKADSGWYKVAVSGDGNIESVNCRAVSDPFLLKVSTCEPPVPPCPELITITADTTVCDTLMPYRWRDTLFTEPATYEILYKDQRGCDSLIRVLTLNTQICCPELITITVDTTVCDTLMPYRWRDTLFIEPATYEILYKNQRGCDSLLCVLTLNTQICCPKMVTITADTTVCDTLMPYRWRDTLFTEPATYEILYKDQRGCDSLLRVLTLGTQVCCPNVVTITADTTVCDTLMPYRWRDTLFTKPATYEILYKNERGCDSLLRVLTLGTQVCCPNVVTITADTTVCDTLMPYRWRDTLFTKPATYEILYKNERGCDSLLRVLTLGTQVCCPNVVTITADTMVCDTLMPFTWTIGGQTFVFEQAETQEREMPHPKWTECTGTNYVLRLDTFHCEKLWQIIVNKYNWQLLLDNVSLSCYFPQNAVRTYQWYKNEVPIPGANGDDYSEQNELCGRFQLRVEMDNGQTIWSNILEIGKAQVEEPIRVRIYDSHGVPVQENQVSHGVYLYRYEQGDRKWTEKRLIP